MKKWLFILAIGLFIFIPKDTYAASYTGGLDVNLVRAYKTDDSWSQASNGGYIQLGSGRYRNLTFFFKGTNYCQNPTEVATFQGWIESSALGYLGYSSSLNISGAVLKNGGDKAKGLCKVTSISCGPGNVGTTYSGSDSNIKPFQSANMCSFQVSCEMEPGEYISCNDYDNILDFSLAFNGVNTDQFRAYLSPLWFNTSRSTNAVEGSINDTKDAINDTKQSIDDLKDSITDSDTSGASDSAGGFFTDFEDDDYGLSDIVTLPLTFIQGLANAECTDLSLPLPFVDENVELPCMSAIYQQYAGAFLTIYQIITFGIVGYWVCVNTLRLVNNFKNPDNDEVEVMDL